MSEPYDLAVIGAGPAGAAAAVQAAALGLRVGVLDEQQTPGGLLYHSVTRSPLPRDGVLDDSYWEGAPLMQALLRSGAEYLPRSSVWNIDRDGGIGVTRDGQAQIVHARHVLLATGAIERPHPFPGWTLPGVMTAGAAQVLLKGAGAVPSGRVVLAGTGPLLLLAATQLVRAGATIMALLDMAPPGANLRAAGYLPRALQAPGYLSKGLALLGAIRRARVPVLRGARHLRATGTDRLEAVEFVARGRRRHIPADLLLVHVGVIPNTVFTRLLRIEHEWNARQRCWQPVSDEWGRTSLPLLSLAGDGAGIQGGWAATHGGRLAALDAARALGRINRADRDHLAVADRRALRRHRAIRPFLDTYFRPPSWLDDAAPDTVLCRCEEVTVGDVRVAVARGSRDPNQVKAVTRCGMGPCQSRQCGQPLAQLVAAETGMPEHAIPLHRLRAPLRSLSIGELAALQTRDAA